MFHYPNDAKPQFLSKQISSKLHVYILRIEHAVFTEMTVENNDSIGIATLSARDFSRALGKLRVITRDSDSLIAPFAPVVMGRS